MEARRDAQRPDAQRPDARGRGVAAVCAACSRAAPSAGPSSPGGRRGGVRDPNLESFSVPDGLDGSRTPPVLPPALSQGPRTPGAGRGRERGRGAAAATDGSNAASGRPRAWPSCSPRWSAAVRAALPPARERALAAADAAAELMDAPPRSRRSDARKRLEDIGVATVGDREDHSRARGRRGGRRACGVGSERPQREYDVKLRGAGVGGEGGGGRGERRSDEGEADGLRKEGRATITLQ